MRRNYKIGLGITAAITLTALIYREYFKKEREYTPDVAQEWVEYNRNPNDVERLLYISHATGHSSFHLITSQDGTRVFRKEEGSRAPGSYVQFNDLEAGVQEAIREAAKDF